MLRGSVICLVSILLALVHYRGPVLTVVIDDVLALSLELFLCVDRELTRTNVMIENEKGYSMIESLFCIRIFAL